MLSARRKTSRSRYRCDRRTGSREESQGTGLENEEAEHHLERLREGQDSQKIYGHPKGGVEHPFGYAGQDSSKRERIGESRNSVACDAVHHKAYGDHLRKSRPAHRKACKNRYGCGSGTNQRRLRKSWSRAVVLSKSKNAIPSSGAKDKRAGKTPALVRTKLFQLQVWTPVVPVDSLPPSIPRGAH